VNGGDEGEGIWLMDFIYLYKIKQSGIALSGEGRELRGRGGGGGDLTNEQNKPI
jgi:hypothetical protein